MKLIAFALVLVCVTTAISIREGQERKIHKSHNRVRRHKHSDDDSQQQQQQQEADDSQQQQEDNQQQQEGNQQEDNQQEDNQQENGSLISQQEGNQQQQQEGNQQQQQEGNQQQQQQQEGNQQQQQQQEGNQQQQQQQEGNQQQQQQQEGNQQQQQEGNQQQQQEGNQQQQQEGNQQQQQEDNSQQQQQQEDNNQQQQQQEGNSQQQQEGNQQQQEDGQQEDDQQQEGNQQQQEDNDSQQQQEDSNDQDGGNDQEDDDKQEGGAYHIKVPDNTYFEVFVDGKLEVRNMPTHKKVCSGVGKKAACRTEWIEPEEGKKNSDSFTLTDGEADVIVLHGFAPTTTGSGVPSLEFKGPHGLVSTGDSFQCAKNWANFWKDGKTMAPNYRAAFSAKASEDFTKEVPIWVADSSQHHVTCVWTKKKCSKVIKNPSEPCHLVEDKSTPIPAGYNTSPKLSADAGEHPKGKVPVYDTLNLAKVSDTGNMKTLQSIDVVLQEAETQHEDLAGEITKACADPLCKGIYSL